MYLHGEILTWVDGIRFVDLNNQVRRIFGMDAGCLSFPQGGGQDIIFLVFDNTFQIFARYSSRYLLPKENPE